MKRIEFKTAILAKRRSFDESGHYIYGDTGYLYPRQTKSSKNSSPNINGGEFFSAPYQAELQKWLRGQNIFVEVQLDRTSYPKFAVEVFVFNGIIADFVKVDQKDWSLYRTYEEALEVGLLLGLKQIKK